MQDWVVRAMQRWPNVPALFGWLGLDRRGRWLIQGEVISHPRIVNALNQNYAADAQGRWFFQNGPQRGYVKLASAPFILRSASSPDALSTHTGLDVRRPSAAYLDEEGSVLLSTEHGAGEIAPADLDWVLQRLTVDDRAVSEAELASALVLPPGRITNLVLDVVGARLPLIRIAAAEVPAQLQFVRDPQPPPKET